MTLLAYTDTNGHLLTNTGTGTAILDTSCCCGGSSSCCCAVAPNYFTVQFTANLNEYATDGGGQCSGDCSDWIDTFRLDPLDNDAIANLFNTWYRTYVWLDWTGELTPPDPVTADDIVSHHLNGCVYGRFDSLPCGAESMVLRIVKCGGDGSAVAWLFIGWTNSTGDRDKIVITHTVTASLDCCANFSFDNEGVSGVTLAVSSGGTTPCDFGNLDPGGHAPNPSAFILTAHCLVACADCSTLPSAVKIVFDADLNAAAPGCSGAGNCDSWIDTFTLPQLTQTQLNYLCSTWPTTWPQTEPTHRVAGCYYGLFAADLPCSATSMVYQIVSSGATGLAVGTTTIGWADGVYVRITTTHAVSPDSADCCSNITRPNEGVAGITVGLAAAAGVPCDFALVALGSAASMHETAICPAMLKAPQRKTAPKFYRNIRRPKDCGCKK